MKKPTFAIALSIIFSLLVLEVALCLASQFIAAQSHDESSGHPTTQQPVQNEHTAPVSAFSGRILKSGNKFVLAASDNLTTYQLDDQRKAQNFLKKAVTVTGSLDASTGTIRVTAIDPSP
jgi:hypothetical protein